jgi:hypothetical protein
MPTEWGNHSLFPGRAAGAGGARAGGVAGVARARMPGGPAHGNLSHDPDTPGHLWR